MEWLFDLMDLPENLQRGLYVCRPIRGLSAGVMGGILLFLCWLLWPWLWYFDIESTQVWTDQTIQTLQPTLGNAAIPMISTYSEYAGWIVTGMTFLPTLIEMFTVRFASAGIKAARLLVLFFATFDMVTDFPRVSAFVDTLNATGAFKLLLLLMKAPLLLLASFGLQQLFIVFLACGIVLLLNSRGQPIGRKHPNYGPAGSMDV
jgi:hypothetical protein